MEAQEYKKLVEALRWCDADFMHECDNCLYVKYKHSKDDCMDRMLRDAAAAIEDLQAQLPKRGEWVHLYKNNFRCSLCGSWFIFEDENNPYEDGRFCSYCGAKMTEVQDGQK